jgi:hypothetical protein
MEVAGAVMHRLAYHGVDCEDRALFAQFQLVLEDLLDSLERYRPVGPFFFHSCFFLTIGHGGTFYSEWARLRAYDDALAIKVQEFISSEKS